MHDMPDLAVVKRNYEYEMHWLLQEYLQFHIQSLKIAQMTLYLIIHAAKQM